MKTNIDWIKCAKEFWRRNSSRYWLTQFAETYGVDCGLICFRTFMAFFLDLRTHSGILLHIYISFLLRFAHLNRIYEIQSIGNSDIFVVFFFYCLLRVSVLCCVNSSSCCWNSEQWKLAPASVQQHTEYSSNFLIGYINRNRMCSRTTWMSCLVRPRKQSGCIGFIAALVVARN